MTTATHIKAADPEWKARQFHVLPERSHQHQFLLDLWAAVKKETGGRLDVSVHPQSDGRSHGGADALEMLIDGELEFYTLNGNAIGKRVPPAEIQGVPYAFVSSADVHRANDGALGEYISRECAANGIHRFARGLMENGFRQTYTFDRPIRHVDDLAGMRIRTPAATMIRDVVASLGAEPVVINILEIRKALEQRRVDGHENPLIIMDVGGFHELTPFVSITRHMWTGFNLIASLKFWNRLPPDVQAIVETNVTKFVAKQRAYTIDMNDRLGSILVGRGMTLTRADMASFKRKLQASGFYERWKKHLGREAWSLLEDHVGKVG
ncbi:MAG TPA: TRAP transporter substrate-binding protein [Xanthobacteraceae bacterium]|nr:TRAP transporter substrate-binding protein [Xanthobacteraceae bacterium]